MSEKDLELTRDITVAWLGAYKTDLSIRRQKGVVPLFTPTNEEVLNFITETYKRVSDLSAGKEIKLPEKKEETLETPSAKPQKLDILADLKKNLNIPVPFNKEDSEKNTEKAEEK